MTARTFILRPDSQSRALWPRIVQLISDTVKAGKPVAVQVGEAKAKRSTEQNRRLWAIYRAIAAQVEVDGKRFSDEVWHEHMKRKFLGCVDLPNGDKMGVSTTTLSTAEFADYMQQVEVEAVMMGAQIDD